MRSVKQVFLKILQRFTGEYLCQSLFFDKVAGLRPGTLLKKETLAQLFSCEFREICKNTFPYRTPPVAMLKTLFFYAWMLRLCKSLGKINFLSKQN